MLSEVRELIRVRDKAERDYNSAILQARMDGEEIAKKKFEKERKKAEAKARQEKIERAKQMLEDGMPINLVTKYSGLSVEEIQCLK